MNDDVASLSWQVSAWFMLIGAALWAIAGFGYWIPAFTDVADPVFVRTDGIRFTAVGAGMQAVAVMLYVRYKLHPPHVPAASELLAESDDDVITDFDATPDVESGHVYARDVPPEEFDDTTTHTVPGYDPDTTHVRTYDYDLEGPHVGCDGNVVYDPEDRTLTATIPEGATPGDRVILPAPPTLVDLEIASDPDRHLHEAVPGGVAGKISRPWRTDRKVKALPRAFGEALPESDVLDGPVATLEHGELPFLERSYLSQSITVTVYEATALDGDDELYLCHLQDFGDDGGLWLVAHADDVDNLADDVADGTATVESVDRESRFAERLERQYIVLEEVAADA